MRDEELVERTLAGELSAFDELVARHAPRVHAIAVRYAGQEADDAAQEAFIRAFTYLDRYAFGSFGAWIGTVAANAAKDVAEAGGRRRFAPIGPEELQIPEEPPPEAPRESVLAAARGLHEAVGFLPEAYRDTMLLWMAGKSFEEIAHLTGTSANTARQRKWKASAMLRSMVEYRPTP